MKRGMRRKMIQHRNFSSQSTWLSNTFTSLLLIVSFCSCRCFVGNSPIKKISFYHHNCLITQNNKELHFIHRYDFLERKQLKTTINISNNSELDTNSYKEQKQSIKSSDESETNEIISIDEESTTIAPRQRRERYSGKYPRNFNQKYKELRGDADTIAKVKAKGMTPAGTHIPIMLQECMEHMGLLKHEDTNIHPKLVVDCTLGYGGHSQHILDFLSSIPVNGNDGSFTSTSNTMPSSSHHLIAFDQDNEEILKTEARLRLHLENHMKASNVKFTAVNQNFETVASYLTSTYKLGSVNSLLADLGVSSMQIDNNERGFTYKREGPLDMRMNTRNDDIASPSSMTSSNATADRNNKLETAYELLCRLKPKEFAMILKENSDEIYADQIAFGLLPKQSSFHQKDTKSDKNNNEKENTEIPQTTTDLATNIRDIVTPLILERDHGNNKKVMNMINTKQNKLSGIHEKIMDSKVLTKNQEKNLKKELDSTIARTMQALRIEINGEFRVLEQLLADLPRILAPGGRAVFLTFHSGEDRRVKLSFKDGFKKGIYSSWSRDVVRPSKTELRDNPRSSCCKLRWVVRSE